MKKIVLVLLLIVQFLSSNIYSLKNQNLHTHIANKTEIVYLYEHTHLENPSILFYELRKYKNHFLIFSFKRVKLIELSSTSIENKIFKPPII